MQAQPTTLAHYLLALASALARETQRLQQAYARINQSPLGAAALATSSFKLDRARTAVLLGFDGVIENAYDANHLAPIDCFLEVASALAIAAVQLGHVRAGLARAVRRAAAVAGAASRRADGRFQHHAAEAQSGRARTTARAGLDPARRNAWRVPARAQQRAAACSTTACTIPLPAARALLVFKLFGQIIDGLVVNKERALAEVNADYSTTTEIADALLQRADVPFRIGHHFASQLTDYGRGKGLTLHEIPYAEAARIYAADTQQQLPLNEAAYREIISAEYMVFGRQGIGGPQPAEVKRMLGDERTKAAADRQWHQDTSARLAKAAAASNQAFNKLARS